MPFLTREVFASRLDSMRSLMDENQLDALAFLTPDYFFYATNYYLDVAPWERPIVAVIPRFGEPFCIMHELSTNHVRMAKERGTLWMDDVSFYSEHPRLTNRIPLTLQWPELVAQKLRSRGLISARIGVDTTGGPISRVPAYLQSGASLVPSEERMRELRWVKHQEELALVRKAGLLSDFGQECFKANIRGGRSVQELDSAVTAQIMAEASRRYPGEHVEVRLFSLSGPGSAAPHGTGAPTGSRIEEGHGIVNVLIVRLNGLVVENERTWFCGQPTDAQAKAFHAATEAQETAIAELYAGNVLANVDAAALAVVERAGYGDYVLHRTGHGVGIAGHEFPDDMPFNLRPLRTGEVYSAEPGIYIYGMGGFRHDDTVIVGETPEVVTHTPKDIVAQTIL
ncbi:M24 family metallopeptidase [Alicyclobacillus mengziensis]|uniref:Aminopeptidase P family protein n=1 Tax=Alicyclobacillus mengziensis TaxID=2931921 RepID=A0A9X7Z980_9BACL|nr:Xaa-Pro peptidase family protein [Alicyclobacillus mengziensis]QSO49325.1 aminopeptidase P family protein [Alicyclobacillus mengziensis]